MNQQSHFHSLKRQCSRNCWEIDQIKTVEIMLHRVVELDMCKPSRPDEKPSANRDNDLFKKQKNKKQKNRIRTILIFAAVLAQNKLANSQMKQMS